MPLELKWNDTFLSIVIHGMGRYIYKEISIHRSKLLKDLLILLMCDSVIIKSDYETHFLEPSILNHDDFFSHPTAKIFPFDNHGFKGIKIATFDTWEARRHDQESQGYFKSKYLQHSNFYKAILVSFEIELKRIRMSNFKPSQAPTVKHLLHRKSHVNTNDNHHQNINVDNSDKKAWKYTIPIVTILIIVILIFGLYQLYRSYQKKTHSDKSSEPSSIDQSASNTNDSKSDNKSDNQFDNEFDHRDSIKKFKRGALIGAGAYGKVFHAYDCFTGASFATKQVSIEKNIHNNTLTNEKQVSHLQNEINILSQLNHPNILKYMGCAIDDKNRHMYVHFEYVSGGNMKQVMTHFSGKFPLVIVKKYTKQILNGLAFLHNENKIHRDIKPTNILITQQGVCKLADFGTCTLIEDITKCENLEGTKLYLSPEAMQTKPLTYATDIWALGITVIEMTVGYIPWQHLHWLKIYKYITNVQFEIDLKKLLNINTNYKQQESDSGKLETINENDISDELILDDELRMKDSSTESRKVSIKLTPLGCDFVFLCLRRDPKRRPTAEILLKHAFLQIDENDVKELETNRESGVAFGLDENELRSGIHFEKHETIGRESMSILKTETVQETRKTFFSEISEETDLSQFNQEPP